MTGPTYDQILDIMHETMAQVTVGGHDLKLCVWELSPSIRRTIENQLRHDYSELQMVGGGIAHFCGIPIRDGVTDEGTGILLKMVNLKPQE